MCCNEAKRLERDFFARDTVMVAQDLLGRTLFFKGQCGRITETEAYLGFDDPASHAARGLTPRTVPMFGPPGFSYVYFIYGMYFCLNIVTETDGFPAAVLIRGMLGEDGVHYNGPGKLCRAFGITKADNHVDIVTAPDFMVLDTPHWPGFEATPRIGIKVGLDKQWRFVVPKTVVQEEASKLLQPIPDRLK